MRKGQQRSAYESRIAAASRILYNASEIAETLGDEGAADDCLQIRTELSRMLDDSVSGRKRRRRQLELLDS